jgi:putative nucleotidyltransferase with HDIG domain
MKHTPFRQLPLKLKITLITIYTITCILFFMLIKDEAYMSYCVSFKPYDMILFVVVIALTETLTVPFKTVSFSTSFAIHFAALIQFGPLFTIVIIVLGFSLRILKVGNGYKHILNTPYYGTIVNYCELIIPIMIGNYFYILVGGWFPFKFELTYIIGSALFCLLFFIINTLIVSVVLSIRMNKNLWYVYVNNMKLSFLNIIAMAPFGIFVAYIFQQFDHWGVIFLLFPIGLARYTFYLYAEGKSQYIQTVDALTKAIEARDKYTEGHSQRVSQLALGIAKELHYNEFKLEKLKIAAILHDVGKIGVDDSILNKAGMLTAEEFDKIKQHPQAGYDILRKVKNMESILPIVLHHHERYDGNGYPGKKKPEELSLDVFVVQLADSVDAMATDRPYRKALSKEIILDEIKKHSGTQFHPKVVEAYLKLVEKENKAK